jgi:hypothetical protein
VALQNAELMELLLDLTREAGIEVKLVGASARPEFEVPSSSALCRVKGKAWVVLDRSDPVEVQLDVLAQALRSEASEWLEGRYLPPAIRERIGSA